MDIDAMNETLPGEHRSEASQAERSGIAQPVFRNICRRLVFYVNAPMIVSAGGIGTGRQRASISTPRHDAFTSSAGQMRDERRATYPALLG
jgi:hypothetical protein